MISQSRSRSASITGRLAAVRVNIPHSAIWASKRSIHSRAGKWLAFVARELKERHRRSYTTRLPAGRPARGWPWSLNCAGNWPIARRCQRKTLCWAAPRSTPRIPALPKILSLQFPFRPLFSVKSNWLLACTSRDRSPDRTNAVQQSRDCGVGQVG